MIPLATLPAMPERERLYALQFGLIIGYFPSSGFGQKQLEECFFPKISDLQMKKFWREIFTMVLLV
jgi:hypothetical protein